MSWAYRRFRSQVRARVRAFRLDGDAAHLAAVRHLLPDPDEPFETLTLVRTGYTLIGWCSPSVRPDAAAMRCANPGFRISVRRHPRADLGLVGAAFMYGFRIKAVQRTTTEAIDLDLASASPPPFSFRFSSRFGEHRGDRLFLPPATASTAEVLERVDPESLCTDQSCPGGFIDWVGASIQIGRRGGSTKVLHVAQLLAEDPALLYEFAESPTGAPWRRVFVKMMEASSTSAEWTDRFRLAADGLDSEFRSELVPLTVERTSPDVPDPVPGLAQPQPVIDGSVVAFVPGRKVFRAPDPNWLTIDGAELQDGGTVTQGRSLVVYEVAADPSERFVSGVWHANFGSRSHPEAMLLRRAPATTMAIDEGILLGGRNDDNWYHWMVEYLPRVLSIPTSIPDRVPILISDRVLQTGLDALRGLTHRPIVRLDPTLSTRVRRLHVRPPVAQISDTGHRNWADATSIDIEALQRLRDRWGVNTRREGEGRLIFLSRNSSRRGVSNQATLERMARALGFDVVDPATLTFEEQRATFSSADVVVGASGAVMANYLFMRPGSTVIALTSRQLTGFVLPPAIASVAGCAFVYVTGRSAIRRSHVRDANDLIHASFRVPPRAFRQALINALATLRVH